MDKIIINFGGFIPLSAVNWWGKSVCVVFFRGCPIKCWYCRNEDILYGADKRSVEEILQMIRDASLLISGVVFSGGEATMQPLALKYLAENCKKMGLNTGLHTNGVFPNVISSLIDEKNIDHIALDIKAEWNLYAVRGKRKPVYSQVKESLSICSRAYHNGNLSSFEVVITIFPGYTEEVITIAKDIPEDINLVLLQGVLEGIKSLDLEKLKRIADTLNRKVKIRTEIDGEVTYEGTSSSGDAGIRKR